MSRQLLQNSWNLLGIPRTHDGLQTCICSHLWFHCMIDYFAIPMEAARESNGQNAMAVQGKLLGEQQQQHLNKLNAKLNLLMNTISSVSFNPKWTPVHLSPVMINMLYLLLGPWEYLRPPKKFLSLFMVKALSWDTVVWCQGELALSLYDRFVDVFDHSPEGREIGDHLLTVTWGRITLKSSFPPGVKPGSAHRAGYAKMIKCPSTRLLIYLDHLICNSSENKGPGNPSPEPDHSHPMQLGQTKPSTAECEKWHLAWNTADEEAFRKLKTAFTTVPFLKHPHPSKSVVVEVQWPSTQRSFHQWNKTIGIGIPELLTAKLTLK